MTYPRIEVDVNKIRLNASKLVGECKKKGIVVAGVTKVFCGNQKIAKALVDGGVELLADSRIENLIKLSDFTLPKMLLRLPMLSQAEKVVKYADISLVSDLVTAKALSEQAIKQIKVHNIILMVDLGDLREGIFDEHEISYIVKEILLLKGVNLLGVGSNLTCYGGVIPTKTNLSKLIAIKQKIEDEFGIKLEVISGGNSGVISLFKDDHLPLEVNQLRLGASISLGIGLNDEPIDGLYYDSFKLIVEVIEIKNKPSLPIGEIGLDAFGNKPVFEDNGIRKRAICAIGKQDIDPKNIIPYDKSIVILGASSDHLILDVTEAKSNYSIGDKIEFNVSYGGCLAAMTSEYVYKVILEPTGH